MLSNADIRRQGSDNLRGNYLAAIGNFFIITVISSILQSLFTPELGFTTNGYSEQLSGGELVISVTFSIIASFIMALLTIGLHWGFLDIQDGDKMSVGHLFMPFKYQPMKVVGFAFRKQLFIMLWSLLFIIPGIIKTYAWAMADFIYYDEPDLPNQEILAKSDALMQGNKWRLFRLEFYYSFLYFVPILIWIAGLAFFSASITGNSDQWSGLTFVWIFVGAIIVGIIIIILTFILEPRRSSARAAFYTQL
ncbi:DUF975 family protein [Jeotgalibaca sp. A122]|uniref:DUF975 family protein n=1 Tax=Jeotgalibaca sp. A122 TaxID=3457322 RepID=UPI003FCFA03D